MTTCMTAKPVVQNERVHQYLVKVNNTVLHTATYISISSQSMHTRTILQCARVLKELYESLWRGLGDVFKQENSLNNMQRTVTTTLHVNTLAATQTNHLTVIFDFAEPLGS